MPKSNLACHTCRKRKVKCDREFPQCMVCGQTGQPCNYPLHPMKPGPKIGSLQRQKRCHPVKKTKRTDQTRQADSHSSSPANVPYGDDFEGLDDISEKEGLLLGIADRPEATVGTETHEVGDRQQNSHLNMHDLSFIIHPCHESSTPGHNQNPSPKSKEGGQAGLCRLACNELGVSLGLMNQMIRVYFDNMVAINIFHEPSFPAKLLEIPSLCQISALLAAIATYASRFLPQEANFLASDEQTLTEASHLQPAYFVDLAFNHINKALAECGDELPPLCVIQALTIATHCQLTQGVHGKAWRSLGLCVRLAYETNLHLLDSRMAAKPKDPAHWQADEEKRRVFWAIWEMDVFASTIRRTPTAIDWRQMEILLPVDNANWFQCHPVPSCFMEAEPNQRWKALQESGNQSPKAWFLVINSLMKAAQTISNPRGMAPMGNPVHYQPTHRTSTPESIEEARQKLETLANAVCCFGLALPGHLQYRDQHLAFGPPRPHQFESQRQQHSSIYNIFVMAQLAQLMIHRYDAFSPQINRSEINCRNRPEDSTDWNGFSTLDAGSSALRHYFKAADSILGIVNQSCEEHIQHINPFLSSTIWLASAVQLVRKHFARTPANRSLIKSRFEVLYFTYKRCVQFWDTQTALQQNLESLEAQLEAQHVKSNSQGRRSSQKTSKRTLDEAALNNHSSTDRQCDQTQNGAKRKQTCQHASYTAKRDNVTNPSNFTKIQDNRPTQFLPETPPTMPVQLPAHSGQGELEGMATQGYTKQQPGAAENMTMLDFMALPPVNRNQTYEPYMMPTDPLFDSTDLLDTRYDQNLALRNLDFSSEIHDLLAGWSTY